MSSSQKQKQILFFSILVAAVAFFLYAGSLGFGFVYDDNYQVILNYWIRSFRYIPDMFTKNAWAYEGNSSNYYRPLMHLAYLVVYKIAGEKAWAFHLLNVLSNCAASVMAFFLALRLFRRTGMYSGERPAVAALFAGLLFAAHPVHTEAVDWVASFPEMSCAFFYFLSIYLYLGKEGQRSKKALAGSLAAFCLAALSKETGLTLCVAIVALDIVLNERPLVARIKNYVFFAALSLAYLALRFHAVGRVYQRDLGISGPQIALNSVVNFSMYLAKLVFPVNLNAFHVFHPVLSIADPKGLFAIALAVAFFVAAFFTWKKRKLSFMGLAMIFIPLAPVLYLPVFFKDITFAERYLYLPSFGFALALADISFEYINRRTLKPAAAALSAVFALYCAGTLLRNPVWQNDFTFAQKTVQQSPDSAAMRNELGMDLQERNMPDEAIKQYSAAYRLNPSLKEPLYNIGTAYAAKGMPGEAEKWFKRTLSQSPYYTEAHEQLGLLYLNEGRNDDALNEFSAAVNLNPDLADDRNDLGLVLLRKGLYARAYQQFYAAAVLSPSSVEPRTNMGLALLEMGKPDEAAAQFKAALKINPRSAAAYQGLAAACLKKGMKDQAMEYFRMALQLDPSNDGIRKDLAELEKTSK